MASRTSSKNDCCLDCENYKRKLKENEQTVSARDVLIEMLQAELKKKEVQFRNAIDEHENLRFVHCSVVQDYTNLKEIHKKCTEENRRLREDKNLLLAKLKEYEGSQRTSRSSLENQSRQKRQSNSELTNIKTVADGITNIQNIMHCQNKSLRAMLVQLIDELKRSRMDKSPEREREKEINQKPSCDCEPENREEEYICSIECLKKQLENLNSFVDKLKKENKKIKENLLEKQASLANCLSVLESNNADIDNLSEHVEGLCRERDKYREDATALETELLTKESEICKLKLEINQFEDSKAENSKLTCENCCLKSNLEKYMSECDRLKKELKTLANNTVESELKVTNAQEIDELKSQIEQLSCDNCCLQSTLKDCALECENLRKNLESNAIEGGPETDEINNLNKKISDLNCDKCCLQSELEKCLQECENLKELINSKVESKEDLENIDDLKHQISEMNCINCCLKSNLEKCTTESESLKGENRKLASDICNLKSSIEMYTAENKSLKKQIECCIEEKTEIQRRSDEYKCLYERLKVDFDKNIKEFSDYKEDVLQTIDQLKNDLQTAAVQQESVATQCKKECPDVCNAAVQKCPPSKNLTTQVDELDIAVCPGTCNRPPERETIDLEQHTQEVAALQDELAKCKCKLKNKIKNLEEDNGELKNNLSILVGNYDKNNKKLEEEFEQCKCKLTNEVETLEEENSNLIANLKTLENKSNSCICELEAKIRELENENEDCNEMIKNLSNGNQSNMKKLEENYSVCKCALENKIKQLEEENKNLRETLDIVSGDDVTTQDEFDACRCSLENKIKVLEKENKNLRETLNNSTIEYDTKLKEVEEDFNKIKINLEVKIKFLEEEKSKLGRSLSLADETEKNLRKSEEDFAACKCFYEHRIAELENENKILMDTLEKEKEQNQEVTKKIRDDAINLENTLQEQCKCLQEENSQYKKKSEEAIQSNASLHECTCALDQKIKDLETENQSLIDTINKETSEYKETISKLKDDAVALENMLQGQINYLQEQVENLMQQKLKKQSNVIDVEEYYECKCTLEQEIKQLQDENRDLRATLSIVNRENISNLNKINELSRSLKKASEELEIKSKTSVCDSTCGTSQEKLRSNADVSSEGSSKLKEEINQLQEKLRYVEKELETANLELTEYEEENRSYAQRLQSLMNEITCLQEVKLRVDEDNSEFGVRMNQMQEEFTSLSQEKDLIIAELNKKIGELECKLLEFDSNVCKIKELTQENQELQNKVNDNDNTIADFKEQLCKLQCSNDKIKSLEISEKQKDEQLNKCLIDLKTIQVQLDENKCNCEEYEKKINDLESDKTMLEKKILTLEASIEATSRETEYLRGVTEELEKGHANINWEEIEKDNQELINQLNNFQEDLKQKQEMIRSLEECIDKSNNILENCEHEMRMVQANNEKLREDLASKHKEVESFKKDSSCPILKNKIEQLLKENQQLKQNGCGCNQQQIDKQISKLQLEYNKLLAESQEKDNELEDIRQLLLHMYKDDNALDQGVPGKKTSEERAPNQPKRNSNIPVAASSKQCACSPGTRQNSLSSQKERNSKMNVSPQRTSPTRNSAILTGKQQQPSTSQTKSNTKSFNSSRPPVTPTRPLRNSGIASARTSPVRKKVPPKDWCSDSDSDVRNKKRTSSTLQGRQKPPLNLKKNGNKIAGTRPTTRNPSLSESSKNAASKIPTKRNSQENGKCACPTRLKSDLDTSKRQVCCPESGPSSSSKKRSRSSSDLKLNNVPVCPVLGKPCPFHSKKAEDPPNKQTRKESLCPALGVPCPSKRRSEVRSGTYDAMNEQEPKEKNCPALQKPCPYRDKSKETTLRKQDDQESICAALGKPCPARKRSKSSLNGKTRSDQTTSGKQDEQKSDCPALGKPCPARKISESSLSEKLEERPQCPSLGKPCPYREKSGQMTSRKQDGPESIRPDWGPVDGTEQKVSFCPTTGKSCLYRVTIDDANSGSISKQNKLSKLNEDTLCPILKKPCPYRGAENISDKQKPEEGICPSLGKPCPYKRSNSGSDAKIDKSLLCPTSGKPCLYQSKKNEFISSSESNSDGKHDEDICPTLRKPCPYRTKSGHNILDKQDNNCPAFGKPCPNKKSNSISGVNMDKEPPCSCRIEIDDTNSSSSSRKTSNSDSDGNIDDNLGGALNKTYPYKKRLNSNPGGHPISSDLKRESCPENKTTIYSRSNKNRRSTGSDPIQEIAQPNQQNCDCMQVIMQQYKTIHSRLSKSSRSHEPTEKYDIFQINHCCPHKTTCNFCHKSHGSESDVDQFIKHLRSSENLDSYLSEQVKALCCYDDFEEKCRCGNDDDDEDDDDELDVCQCDDDSDSSSSSHSSD